MFGDDVPSCQINLSKCVKAFSNISGGTGIYVTCVLFLAIFKQEFHNYWKNIAWEDHRICTVWQKGTSLALFTGEWRWESWGYEPIGKKTKNSSLSWSMLNPAWISSISVLECTTKASRKDPPGGHCLFSTDSFERFTQLSCNPNEVKTIHLTVGFMRINLPILQHHRMFWVGRITESSSSVSGAHRDRTHTLGVISTRLWPAEPMSVAVLRDLR